MTFSLTNSESTSPQLRLRVFAGPNGSGKSTVINAIRDDESNGRPIDIGYYINADEIASQLSLNEFSFDKYDLVVKNDALYDFIKQSGLLNNEFTLTNFQNAYTLRKNKVRISDFNFRERIAQVFARFLREELLKLRRRFSFETVFSHPSNLEIMRQAAAAGYKVYLYFVSTESPEINKYRVALRVKQKGHYVVPDTIEKRYYRSLGLLYEAAQIAYQSFFFDNSIDGAPFRLIAHFKKYGDEKEWDELPDSISAWFKAYYSDKVKPE
jgi:predicted ABC-type ATPase